jgi:rhodanese-related sulfurtransferase
MGDRPDDIQEAVDQAQKTQEDLDRRVFYLKTLFETSRELAGVIQPRRILDEFLLMAMGALGIARGLAALVNTRTARGHVIGRGIADSQLDDVTRNLPLICGGYLIKGDPSDDRSPLPRIVMNEGLSDHRLFPTQTNILVLWDLAGEHAGFLALGERISGRPCDDGDIDLLLNLTNILTGALNHALSVLDTQQLNANLLQKNAELEQALGEILTSRDALDKRIFHLKSLSDLNSELSPLIDMDRLLQAYLMTTMGSVGVGQGFVLVHDRAVRAARFAARGLEREPVLDDAAGERLLYQSFEASESKSLTPMSVSRIGDLAPFRAAGLNIDAALGLFFVIDHSFMGVISLGRTLTGDPYSPEEVDLLTTQTTSFMVFLKNAKAFETIQTLNEGLTRRNEELRQTISELTEAKDKITLLEKARTRVRSLLQKEAARIDRASGFDCALILILALAVGIIFNVVAPQGIPLLQESVMRARSATVDPGTAKGMVEEEGALLVDARPKELYDQKHIKGAVNIPLSLFDIMYMMKLGSLDPERPLIVYGRNISRLYDEELAFRLKQRDHERVRLLDGGLSAWESQGYQVD